MRATRTLLALAVLVSVAAPAAPQPAPTDVPDPNCQIDPTQCPMPPSAPSCAQGQADPILAYAGRPQTYNRTANAVRNPCVADAVVEGQRVFLDARESRHRNNITLRYHWQQVVGPQLSLEDPTAALTSFIAPPRPAGYARGCDGAFTANPTTSPPHVCLRFQLTVSDHLGHSNTTFTDVLVNERPIADAGADQEVRELSVLEGTGRVGRTHVHLRADGDPPVAGNAATAHPGSRDAVTPAVLLNHHWRQIAGPAVSLSSTTEPRINFTAPIVPGDAESVVLEFELRVDDGVPLIVGSAFSAPDRVRVTVLPYRDVPEIRNLRLAPDGVDIDADRNVLVAFVVQALPDLKDPGAVDDPATPTIDESRVGAGGNRGAVRTVEVFLRSPAGNTLQVPMFEIESNPGNYTGFLSASDRRLVLDPDTGSTTYEVWAVATSDANVSNSTLGIEEITFTVTGPSDALPAVRLAPTPPQAAPGPGEPCFPTPASVPPIILGPGEAIELDVCMDGSRVHLLRDVSYQVRVERGDPPVEVLGQRIPVPSPYRIPASSLAGGDQDVLVTVRDRLGHEETLTVPTLVDFGPPDVFLVAPNVTYQNVSFPIVVFVQDDSPRDAVLDLDGNLTILDAEAPEVTDLPAYQGLESEVEVKTFLLLAFRDQRYLPSDLLARRLVDGRTFESYLKEGPTKAFVFQVERSALGPTTYNYEVRDRAGNTVAGGGALVTEPAYTDAFLKSARALDPRVLPGQPVRLEAVLRQIAGVGTIPLTVTFTGDGRVLNETAEVPLDADTSIIAESPFRPGRHVLVVTVSAPPSITERDATNQLRTVELEVFLGQTVFAENGKVYWIRADAQGLPDAAVDLEARRTFDLVLNNTGERQRFEFTVGQDLLWWDPLQRNETNQPVTTVPKRVVVVTKDTPLPFAVPLLAVAAAVALSRRRLR